MGTPAGGAFFITDPFILIYFIDTFMCYLPLSLKIKQCLKRVRKFKTWQRRKTNNHTGSERCSKFNDKIFNDKVCEVLNVVDEIKVLSSRWSLARLKIPECLY